MKIKISNLYSIVICLLCFAMTDKLSILPIPFINNIWNWRFACFLLGCITFFSFFGNVWNINGKSKPYFKVYKFYIPFFFLAMIILFVYSMQSYNESIYDVLIASMGQFYVLLFPAIIYIYIKEDGIEDFFELLNKMLIIVVLLYVFANILYLGSGINIFKVSLRYGHLRFDPPFFGGILCLYNLWKYIIDRKRYNLFLVIGYLLYLFTMSGTRAEMISLVVALILEVLIFRKNIDNQIIVIAITIIAITIANYCGLFDRIIDSFGQSSDLSLSTSVRMEALEYFKAIQKKTPLVGMGYIRGKVKLSWDNILYGPYDKYVFSDVGVLGFFYKTGYLSFIIIGIPFARIIYLYIKTIIKRSKNKLNQCNALLTSIFVYFSICQVSLSVTDVQRSLLLPIVWATFEYIAYKKV